MIIRSQCLPGGYNHAGHTPRHPWPEDCIVQWGDSGLVVPSLDRALAGAETDDDRRLTYRTAFFEAFPAGTFIRGEGPTVADAEDSAWRQHRRETGCERHDWSPMQPGGRERLDGAGWCRKCGRFESKALPVRTACAKCGTIGKLYDNKSCRPCWDATPDSELDEIGLMTRRMHRWMSRKPASEGGRDA